MSFDADDDTEQAALRLEYGRMFRANWAIAPLGITGAAAVFATMAYGRIATARLVLWLTAIAAVAVAQVVTAVAPPLVSRVNRLGIPNRVPWAWAASGVAYGALPWLQIDDLHEIVPLTTTLLVLYAVGAGTQTGMANTTGVGLWVSIPMWSMTVPAIAVTGRWNVLAGACAYLVLIARDTRLSRRLLVEAVHHRVHASLAARRDPLTGLMNRSGMHELLDVELRGDPTEFALLYFDLDRFKTVNDTLGHAAGDAVLREAARRLTETLGAGSRLARLGGDEFVAIMRAPQHHAERVAALVIQRLEEPFAVEGVEVLISASAGVAMAPGGATTPTQLLAAADRGLYRAKRLGGRHACVAHPLRDSKSSVDDIETALRRAVAQRSLTVDAQPVFDLRSGDVVLVELLARWRQPDGSPVAPDVFIPLAEQLGLIADIGSHVLDIAGSLASRWRAVPRLAHARVSANVSTRQLRTDRIVDEMSSLLVTHGRPADTYLLEITEDHDLFNDPTSLERLHELHRAGFRIAIDDFGAGYSNLRQLLAAPIDTLKIDRSLIRDLDSNRVSQQIVRSIVDLAGRLGVRVVAEGVETDRQLRMLRTLGVDAAQGFVLCAPMPTDSFAVLIGEIIESVQRMLAADPAQVPAPNSTRSQRRRVEEVSTPRV